MALDRPSGLSRKHKKHNASQLECFNGLRSAEWTEPVSCGESCFVGYRFNGLRSAEWTEPLEREDRVSGTVRFQWP